MYVCLFTFLPIVTSAMVNVYPSYIQKLTLCILKKLSCVLVLDGGRRRYTHQSQRKRNKGLSRRHQLDQNNQSMEYDIVKRTRQ